MTDDLFRDPRRDKNTKHELTGMLRQSVYRRLAGYKDTNDAERLAVGCVCNMTYQEAVDLQAHLHHASKPQHISACLSITLKIHSFY